MSVETAPQLAELNNNGNNEQTQDGHYHRKRRAFKRVASKIFGRGGSDNNGNNSTTTSDNTSSRGDARTSPPSSSRSSSSSSSRTSSSRSSSSSRASSSSRSAHSPYASSSSRHNRGMPNNPSRRASIQGRKNLMTAALPAAGPERRRAAQALLTELEKYDHLQRRSMLRNLPPLQFHVTVEKRVNGRVQETEVEISMNELREELLEILRSEGVNSPLRPRPVANGGLRQIKSEANVGVKDVSVFPTHVHDGRSLPEDRSACTICIEDYVEGDEIKSLPCFHFYHSECIDEWFKRSKCCPNCNEKVEK